MREMVAIHFDPRDLPGRGPAQPIFDALGLGPDVAEELRMEKYASADANLAKEDERLPRLLEELRRRGVEWSERWYDVYSEEELDSARLLVVEPYIPGFHFDAGAEWGTTYDYAKGCSVCGTGAPQTSDLFMDSSHVRKLKRHPMAWTYYDDLVISEFVVDALQKAGATGLLLRGVRSGKKSKRHDPKETGHKQLCAVRTLPPVSPRTIGLATEKQCPVCKRDGFRGMNEAPLRIAYRAEDVAQIDDVNESWEWFGWSELNSKMGFPALGRPWHLVTPKVMRAMRAEGVTDEYCRFIPIRVVDE